MKIGTKVLAGFAAGMALCCIVGGLGAWATLRVKGELDLIAGARFPSVVAANDVGEGINDVGRGLNLLQIKKLGTGPDHDAGFQYVEDGLKLIDSARAQWDAVPHTEAGAAAWKAAVAPIAEWKGRVDACVAAMRERDALLRGGAADDAAGVAAAEKRALDAWMEQRRLVGPIQKAIASSVAKVSEIVAEITAAAREQSSGIDQVNRAVAEMNKVTQQNAASAEESSSAATELTSQAQELTTTVSSFRLDGAARKPARASARVAAAPRPPRPKGSGVNGTVGTALPPRAAFPLEDDRDFQEF